MPSVCFCVTKCPALYALLMYQLRSSGTEIGIRPGASRIGVDVVVWAVVSEDAVYRAYCLLKSVWFCVGNSVPEEDAVEEFGFVSGDNV